MQKKLRRKKYDHARNMAGIICALPAKVLKLNEKVLCFDGFSQRLN